MNPSMLKTLLQKLDEFVMDEDKIVTYKFLSRALGIHVNTAKQLLYLYFQKQKKINYKPISATYLLAGVTEDDTMCVSIVNESDLDDTRKKFSVITSEHVYSIQKGFVSGKQMNSQVLYTADYKLESSKNLPIKCENAVLREGVRPCPEVKEEMVVKNDYDVNEGTSSRKSSPKKAPQKNSISSFFSNQSSKQKRVEESKAEPIELESRSDSIAKPEVAKEKTEKEDPGRKSKKKRERSRGGEKKKRKRIISDSEESEDDEDEEMRDAMLCEETEMPSGSATLRVEDEEEEKVEKQEKVHEKNRRKKKKVVDRTVLLDDGYMETVKEVVFETDSEEEDEALKAKPQQSNPDKGKSGKPTPPQSKNAKKQQSLLSFFKKN